MGRDITIGKNGTKISLSVINKLLFFMVAMLVVPIIVYYFALWAIREYTEVSSKREATFAGIIAILSVNFIMGLYVYVAFTERDDDDNDTENDENCKKKS